MIQDQSKFDKLYSAAEVIYKYMNPRYGFYAGTRKNENNVSEDQFNIMKGSKHFLESKLNRKLNKYEESVLAIAICDMSNKSLCSVLTVQERQDIFTDLWDDKPNSDNVCIPFERLVTTI